jgi:hypothetical protein
MCVCAFTGSFESGSGLDLSLKPRCIWLQIHLTQI